MTDRTLPTEGHASRVMPPVGPEMDALVYRAVRTVLSGSASQHSGAAMAALEAWREQHPEWTGYIALPVGLGDYTVRLFRFVYGEPVAIGRAPTLEVAICQAIIRAHWALEDAR